MTRSPASAAPVSHSDPDAILEWYRGLPVHRVHVNGTPMAYRKVGQGPAVVFVHGWPLTGATWRAAAHALHPQYTCYMPDLPGAGDSPDAVHHPEMFQHIAASITGFIHALGLPRYALAGFDSGGAGARLHAAAHPDAVSGLFLSNTETPGHIPPLVRALKAFAFVPFAAAAFRFFLRFPAFVRSPVCFGGCFHDVRLLEGTFRPASVAPLQQRIKPALAQIRRADLDMTDRLLAEATPRLTMPVHLFWGTADPFFPRAGADRLARALPRCTGMDVVKSAKLLVHEEHAHAHTAAMHRFLDTYVAPDVRGERSDAAPAPARRTA